MVGANDRASEVNYKAQDVAGNVKTDQGPGVLLNVTKSASAANTHTQGGINARLSSHVQHKILLSSNGWSQQRSKQAK